MSDPVCRHNIFLNTPKNYILISTKSMPLKIYFYLFRKKLKMILSERKAPIQPTKKPNLDGIGQRGSEPLGRVLYSKGNWKLGQHSVRN